MNFHTKNAKAQINSQILVRDITNVILRLLELLDFPLQQFPFLPVQNSQQLPIQLNQSQGLPF